MKLIVGLGNPGKEYENTRHNIGFIVIDNFAKNHNISIEKNKFNGLFTKIIINNEDIILLKPLSYMNLSGEVIKKYLDYFKIDISNLLVINDDLDQPFTKIKLKSHGTSGGHNGLKNIETNLGTQEYKRLKIGISNNKLINTKNYVLGYFTEEEQKLLNEILPITNNIIEDFINLDFSKIMNKYN